MDLTGKIFDLFQQTTNRGPKSNEDVPVSSQPEPVAETDDQLNGIYELFANCDRQVPSTAKGSPPEHVNRALAEMMDLDFGRVVREIGIISFSWTMSNISGSMCSGYASCARCGNAVAPMGVRSGTIVIDCGSCKAPVSVSLIEYSPAVGRQIREILKLHKTSIKELERAAGLHEKQQDQEAASICLAQAEAFSKRGHYLAHAQALLNAYRYCRSFSVKQARQCAAEALSIFLERKNVSGLIRSLYMLAVHEWAHDENMSRAIISLVQDISRTHEPEYEGLAFHARCLFLEAALASSRVMTCTETEAALGRAHRFLVDASNRPHCSKLLSLKIEEQFSYVRQKVNRLTADVPALLKRAQVARDAKDENASNLVMMDLLPVAIQLGDLEAIRDISNQLMIDSFKRQDLKAVLDHLQTMELVCRELKDTRSLAAVLQNRSQLLAVVDDKAEAQKLRAEADTIAGENKKLEEQFANDKISATAAIEKKDWAKALALWWKVRDDSSTLGDVNERFQALIQMQSCESQLALHWPRMLTLLESEGLASTNSELLAHVLAQQGATWKALGDLATAGGVLARAALKFNEVVVQQSEGSERDAAKHRDACLADLRQIGDHFAAHADPAAAQRMYSILADAEKRVQGLF